MVVDELADKGAPVHAVRHVDVGGAENAQLLAAFRVRRTGQRHRRRYHVRLRKDVTRRATTVGTDEGQHGRVQGAIAKARIKIRTGTTE